MGFKERIDKIFPHCRPYSCPNKECEFAGKDKQALLRHYTGKHGVLELFLREALEAKGIHYALSDSAKRKSMGNTDQSHRDGGMQRELKKGRLSSTSLDFFLPTPEESSKLLLNDNIMWGGGNSGVTVESSVPVQYLEATEQGFVNLGDIDYDYLYPATVDPSSVHQPMQTAGGEQRLLSFSML